MTIQIRSNDPAPAPEKTVEAAKVEPSAPEGEKPSEQKELTDSEPEGTEANEEDTEEDSEADPKGEAKPDDAAQAKPKKNGFQRRVDKLNGRVTAAQQEAEFWKQQALKGASESKPSAVETKPATAEGKPNPDKFDTHAEYVEALTDWKTDQKFNEREQKAEKARLEAKHGEVVQSYSQRAKAFGEKNPDFAEVLSDVDDIQISPALREIIISSENGPQLAYELAKNREEYARVCKLPPLAAAREMGKLESRLTPASEKNETKKITNASKPLEPVGGGGKGAVKKSIEEIASTGSQAEYEAARRAEIKKRRQA